MRVDKIGAELGQVLKKYSEDIDFSVGDAADKVAKDTAEKLRVTSPKKSGKYARDWTYENSGGGLSNRRIVYNRNHYYLTHLLEFGHVTRGGKRTKSNPHIKIAEEYAVQEFLSSVQAGIRRM